MVEEALANLRKGTAPDGALRRVRDYANYSVAAAMHEGRPRMLMAPDNKGRTLAAIFTFDDTYEAFGPDARAQSGGEPVEQMHLRGEALFNALQGFQLDGIVFNCAGPPAPVAFAPAFARVVMEAR